MNIDSKTILNAYANGVFPMARSVDDKYIEWIKPKKRGIIPIDNFYIPKSLKKTLKKKNYEISIDTNFELTISKCAEIRKDRENTWINKSITPYELYIKVLYENFKNVLFSADDAILYLLSFFYSFKFIYSQIYL